MTDNKSTLLVVDDYKYMRDYLKRILEDAGYGVVTASDGQEALTKISSNDINLVLLDIRMPVMDGFQVLKFIRQNFEIPVIMVTGMDEDASLNNAFDLGADDYVRKPFHSSVLLARITAKLRREQN